MLDDLRLIRQGFWVYVVVASASIAIDLLSGRAGATAIGAYRAIGVLAMILGIVGLRRSRTRRQARLVVPVVIGVVISASLLQDRLSGDPYSTPLLAATVCLTVALIMPWSWRDQSMLAGLGSLGVLANRSIVHGPLFLSVNTTMICAASVGVAFILERNRAALSESRKRAAASEARLRQIADNAREVFWTLDIEHGQLAALSYVSPAAEALLGLAPGAPGPRIAALLERIHPEDRERVAAWVPFAEHVRDPGALNFRIITPDGSTRHVQARFTPIRDDAGVLVRLGGVLEDVTSEREAAAALERARDEAQAAVRSRSHFLAAMTHEISTPLTAILGTLDLLRESGATEVQRRRLDTVYDCAQSLHLMLSDVLDFSKTEAGDLRLQPAAIDLGELVSGIVQLHAARARARGLDLRFEWEGPVLATFVGDAGRLRQVLNNLVSNAIKFTPAGEVCVRASAGADDGGLVRFEVADTGIGVPADQRRRIFEPFSQGDESIARRYGGTGLGLAIAARVVEAMGGQIGVESDSSGSRFWFTVRLGGAAPAGLSAESSGPGSHVLVVAARQTAREELAAEIGHWGVASRAVADLEAAVVELETAGPPGYDVVLLVSDEEAKGREGLIRALLTYRQTAAVPTVLILAPHGRDGDALVARAAGAAGWLPLPLRPATLVASISASSAQPSIAPPPGGVLGPVGRVLVVDDSEIIREVTTEMLRRMGHRCDAVGSGPQALQALQRQRFDLLLLDCEMPGMDGFETAWRIRALEAESGLRIPIIAFSASAPEMYRHRCLAAGMDDFLAKPIRPPALAETLTRWLRATGTPSAPTAPALDRERLTELADHHAAAIRRFSDFFVREARELIVEITQVANGGDPTTLRAALHRVRGAAGYIGATRFERALAQENGPRTDPSTLRGLARELSGALADFEESARALEDELSAAVLS
jgi:two-component system sensor histidine kinase/response regulator